jgi:transposase
MAGAEELERGVGSMSRKAALDEARAVVVRTLAQHLLDLQVRIAELEEALAEVLRADPPSQQLQGQLPDLGPTWMATIRAEVGDVQRFRRVDQLVAYAGLEPPHA